MDGYGSGSAGLRQHVRPVSAPRRAKVKRAADQIRVLDKALGGTRDRAVGSRHVGGHHHVELNFLGLFREPGPVSGTRSKGLGLPVVPGVPTVDFPTAARNAERIFPGRADLGWNGRRLDREMPPEVAPTLRGGRIP
ncbi:hypothetical protein [Parafrankia discariae]|uniref:hypothetical protein n=1 Tax=Parafrankia discariae TaxID=365528 RepID=UPI00039B849D|nr:hypothetical protein [Parafrankia discariae]